MQIEPFSYTYDNRMINEGTTPGIGSAALITSREEKR